MPRVIHFEIHADDPDRACRFYAALFGWQAARWDGPTEYFVLTTGTPGAPGINGGLLRRHGPRPADGQPVNAFVCTIDVPDLDATVGQAQALGGSVAVAKMPVPGVGWLAYIKDPEGNILGLLQPDPAAA